MVLVRKRTWLKKDDELRAFNTTQTERDELIMWYADKGLMLEKSDGWNGQCIKNYQTQCKSL